MRTRDSFGYLEPHKDLKDFAQCSSCQQWIKPNLRCRYFTADKEVIGIDACIMYVPGDPILNKNCRPLNIFKPEDVGFARGKTRCENCDEFKPKISGCNLFYMLTKEHPEIFDLDKDVKPKACCNAFQRPDQE